MSMIRQDATTKEWVILAPDRGHRPHEVRSSRTLRPLVAWEGTCPFCPGNEGQTPPDVLRLAAPSGGGWAVRVIPNKFCALRDEGIPQRHEEGPLFRAMTGVGHHEVIIETPVHNRPLALMTDAEVAQVLGAYQARYQTLRQDPQVRCIILFKNHGERAGTSLRHPHAQLVVMPVAPMQMRRKYAVAISHYDDTGRCLYGDLAHVLSRTLRTLYEVLSDPDFNFILHTAEGNHLGPTLCFRGIDNAAYYRLNPDSARYYIDYTGCGNMLNMRHPRAIQLLMDSLRYWVLEMHVDGFRFDLASALARGLHDVDRLSTFFDVIHQDPAISQVKLIAEPWDLGDGGYQVGNFPVGWAEWNGRYRDAIRRYWRGDPGQVADLASRLTGSSDLYQSDGRAPYASVNFITAHDGFTLADLLSYDTKNNEANGEENRDGTDDNLSWNCGVEGPTDDTAILALRAQQQRNFLATLLFSQGVPMLSGGDELGRSQDGNNNAYCQDNERSWFNWVLDERARQLLAFTQHLLRLRHAHPELRRRKFFQGRPLCAADMKDLLWLRPGGGEMTPEEWQQSTLRTFGFRLCGQAMDEVDASGEAITDDTLLILLNAQPEPVSFVLPDAHPGTCWEGVVDTTVVGDAPTATARLAVGASLNLAGRSLQLLCACR